MNMILGYHLCSYQ